MKTKLTVPLFVMGLAALSATGCSQPDIAREVMSEIETHNGKNVQLANVAAGGWTHFLVICPYDPDVNHRLGFDWPDAPADTYSSDNSQTIVFTKGKSVVSTTQLLLTTVNLCNDIWELEPAATVLNFRKDADYGWNLLPKVAADAAEGSAASKAMPSAARRDTNRPAMAVIHHRKSK